MVNQLEPVVSRSPQAEAPTDNCLSDLELFHRLIPVYLELVIGCNPLNLLRKLLEKG